jgi:antitoxin (DNA-binding transcriptional repressor) of toxin-antitoxin stability system
MAIHPEEFAAAHWLLLRAWRGHVGANAGLLDPDLYILYSATVSTNRQRDTKGVEEARKGLPAILDAATQGRTTIITRRGRAVAAVVPASRALKVRAASLLALAGTGKGMWGRDTSRAVARLRDEWTR